jgi:hypothetical protein
MLEPLARSGYSHPAQTPSHSIYVGRNRVCPGHLRHEAVPGYAMTTAKNTFDRKPCVRR